MKNPLAPIFSCNRSAQMRQVIDMTDLASRTCAFCGAPLSSTAPEGLCPKCLMAGALEPTQHPTGARERRPAPDLATVCAAFPQFEIIQLIGQGGMGAVYKARQPQLDRFVALKLLAPATTSDARFAERFQQEARTLARLSHPNIVTVHDFGQGGSFFYLVMEYVDGVNLRGAMKAGRFSPEQALAVVPPICEALQYAHDRGVVHRDIKPENLLLDTTGRLKIADFGVARLLDSTVPHPEAGERQAAGLTQESVLGTPQYMAPEQSAQPSQVDHRADIYSLGVVLYELLTGELPAAKLEPPSQKVHLDVRLDHVVLRALNRHPELRYHSALEFKSEVETVVSPASTQPVAEPPAGQSRVESKGASNGFVRRHRMLVLSSILIVGLSLFVAILLSSRDYRATVKMEVHPDRRGPGYSKPTGSDEQFIQVQTLVLRNAEMLRPVIEQLNLTKGLSPNDTALSFDEARRRVARSIELRGIPNTDLLELAVYQRNPQRAAAIANAIAVNYQERRLHDQRGSVDIELALLQDEIERLRTQVEIARHELSMLQEGIVDPDPEHLDPLQAGASLSGAAGDYAKAKARFLTNKKILKAAEKRLTDEQVSTELEFEPVRIWDKAEPPSRRARPDLRRIWTGLFN
jgi:serine/threonine protein kinase